MSNIYKSANGNELFWVDQTLMPEEKLYDGVPWDLSRVQTDPNYDNI